MARVTLPERKQRVQTLIRRGEPFTIAFTFLTLGFQFLLVRLWEWETVIPKAISLLQISHLAMVCTSFFVDGSVIKNITDRNSKKYNNTLYDKNQAFFSDT